MDKTVRRCAEAIATSRQDRRSPSVGSACVASRRRCSTLYRAVHRRSGGLFERCRRGRRGVGLLLAAGRLRRIVRLVCGREQRFARRFLSGELEVELTPQGTLAERMRAGGSWHSGLLPRRRWHRGRRWWLPWKYGADGSVQVTSPVKEVSLPHHAGVPAVVARAGDRGRSALVRAWKGDRYGNLRYRHDSAQLQPGGRYGRAHSPSLRSRSWLSPVSCDPTTSAPRGRLASCRSALTGEQAADKRIERGRYGHELVARPNGSRRRGRAARGRLRQSRHRAADPGVEPCGDDVELFATQRERCLGVGPYPARNMLTKTCQRGEGDHYGRSGR